MSKKTPTRATIAITINGVQQYFQDIDFTRCAVDGTMTAAERARFLAGLLLDNVGKAVDDIIDSTEWQPETGTTEQRINDANTSLQLRGQAKPQPTREQVQALADYACKYGRTWKTKLNIAWSNGADDREPNGPLLRQVRNQFGPSWLVKFNLEKTIGGQR